MGSILTLEFVFPDLFAGIPWLVFGRLRQAHVNTVLFAWLSGGMMGLWFYFVPRLTGRRLWSELLGNICVIFSGSQPSSSGWMRIFAGDTQSREYAEMMWPVDWMVLTVLILNAG